MNPAASARPFFDTVDALLADARSRLDRVDVNGAIAILKAGGGMVDIRPGWIRAQHGEIPGSWIVERNHLEWRLHPTSGAHLPIAEAVSTWVVVCSEGYTSSLAADALRSIGIDATDLVGGVQAWKAEGHITIATVTQPDARVAERRTCSNQMTDLYVATPVRSQLLGSQPPD